MNESICSTDSYSYGSESSSSKKSFSCNHSSNYGIMFSNERYEVKTNMSAMIMYFNEKGAIIVSDSRETTGLNVKTDECQKVWMNNEIIFGIIGLYNHKNANFKEIISQSLLNGKSIEETMNDSYNGIRLQKLIPSDETINVFYAKKNGEIGVYDITADNQLKNKIINKEDNLWTNIPKKLKCLYDGLCKRYAIVNEQDKPINYKHMFDFSMQQLIHFEEELEKITNIKSDIGGKVQSVFIEFE